MRGGSQKIGLAQNDIGVLAVGETGSIAEPQHAIVDGVRDIQARRRRRGIERDTLRTIELFSFHQIGVEIIEGCSVLADDSVGRGIERNRLRVQRR